MADSSSCRPTVVYSYQYPFVHKQQNGIDASKSSATVVPTAKSASSLSASTTSAAAIPIASPMSTLTLNSTSSTSAPLPHHNHTSPGAVAQHAAGPPQPEANNNSNNNVNAINEHLLSTAMARMATTAATAATAAALTAHSHNNSNSNHHHHQQQQHGTVTRDAVRTIIMKMLAMTVDELKRDDTKKHIREQLVHPMIRLAYDEAFPYILATGTVVVVILLASLFSLVLSILFFFKR